MNPFRRLRLNLWQRDRPKVTVFCSPRINRMVDYTGREWVLSGRLSSHRLTLASDGSTEEEGGSPLAIAVKTTCSYPGCRESIPNDAGSRCAKHATKPKNTSIEARTGDPFYKSKEWIVVRNERRVLSPLCEECLKQGRVTPMWAVDHIKPRLEFPELALEITNTRSLCESHHNSRTARDAHAKRRQERGAGKFERS